MPFLVSSAAVQRRCELSPHHGTGRILLSQIGSFCCILVRETGLDQACASVIAGNRYQAVD